MKSTIEKHWITKVGYRAAVLLLGDAEDVSLSRLGIEPQWRNGYVAIENTHPFYGIEYNEQSDKISQEIAENQTLGKKSPILMLTAGVGSDKPSELVRRSPDIVIDCHGGLTYSGGNKIYPVPSDSNWWWFGFDCHHCDDTLALCTLEYVENECERVAEQLKRYDIISPT